MKHHPPRLGLRQATKPESLLRGSARDEETRRLFLVEQTLEWVACASHIFIDFISLWLLCHAGPGVRIHTRARYEEKRERERIKTKKIIERKGETQGEIYRDDPVMGQLRAVAEQASTRHFISRHLSRILWCRSRIRSSVRLRWFYSVYFSKNFDISWQI